MKEIRGKRHEAFLYVFPKGKKRGGKEGERPLSPGSQGVEERKNLGDIIAFQERKKEGKGSLLVCSRGGSGGRRNPEERGRKRPPALTRSTGGTMPAIPQLGVGGGGGEKHSAVPIPDRSKQKKLH